MWERDTAERTRQTPHDTQSSPKTARESIAHGGEKIFGVTLNAGKLPQTLEVNI